MYKSTIILLIFVVAVSSYYLHQFPYSVIIAVLACCIIEIVLRKFYAKKSFEFPYTAIITGIIMKRKHQKERSSVKPLIGSMRMSNFHPKNKKLRF